MMLLLFLFQEQNYLFYCILENKKNKYFQVIVLKNLIIQGNKIILLF